VVHRDARAAAGRPRRFPGVQGRRQHVVDEIPKAFNV
jgi:hypothetical protein